MITTKKKRSYTHNPEPGKYWLYIIVFCDQSVYVGISKAIHYSKRWQNGKGYKNSEVMSKAIAKYGWESTNHLVNEVRYDTKEAAERAESNLVATFIMNGYSVLNTQKLPIYNVTKNAIYYSCVEAAKDLQVPVSSVSKALKGEYKTAGGCELRRANREDLINGCHRYNVKGEFKYVD